MDSIMSGPAQSHSRTSRVGLGIINSLRFNFVVK